MRPQGWETRLADAIKTAQGSAWQWGVHDCASFARACASAVLDGATPWDHLFGYRSLSGMRRVIGRVGGLAQGLDAVERIPVACARRGDLALVRGADGMPDAMGQEAVAVFNGRCVVLAADGGVGFWPVSQVDILSAWPVGDHPWQK